MLINEHGSHGLYQLLDLFVQPSDVRICFGWLFIHLHSLHTSIVFCKRGQLTSFHNARADSPAGNLSRIKYESLFTPMRSLGRSSSCGTRPITGRKTVWTSISLEALE